MPILKFIQQGGVVMYPLFVLSVLTLGIIFDRFYFLWGAEKNLQVFHKNISALMEKPDANRAEALCRVSKCFLAPIFLKALNGTQRNNRQVAFDLTLGKNDSVAELKRYLWVLGTVGAAAPFIGLLGTVVGIIRSFHDMSTAGTGGFDVVASGISEALIATAAGLVVGILSVMAYNYFTVRVNRIASMFRDYIEEFRITFLEKG